MADYTLHLGDCLDVMRTMNANSVDTVVCDPPYGLSFMGKNWDHGVPGIPFWIVLDPFMGSGSTGIAALQEWRSFVGIELDGDYYAIAEKRIANVMVQPELEAVR